MVVEYDRDERRWMSIFWYTHTITVHCLDEKPSYLLENYYNILAQEIGEYNEGK
jgi:hypothetical protein